MTFRRILSASLALVGLVSATAWTTAAHADELYVALGDSFAWGYDKGAGGGQSPGAGGGYYSLFSQFLNNRNGSVGLQSFNFGVPGETTETYFSGTIGLKTGPNYPAGLVDAPFRNQSYNTNYTVADTPQAALFTNLADSLAPGDSIKYITVQFGGNDILGTAAQFLLNPAFASLTPLDQQTILTQRFQDMATNYATILATVKAKAPDAQIFILTYPDAFQGLGAFNPLPSSNFLNTTASNIFQSLASSFGATFVDVRADFVGQETTLTNILTNDGDIPNFHPNASGYQVIANRLISVAAPEPGTFALLAFAGLPIVGMIRRRRAR